MTEAAEVETANWESMTDAQISEAERLQYAEIVEQCGKSLEVFLANVTIDSRPEPKRWGDCIDDWQNRDIVRPLIPAMEAMAGIRDDYTGPRKFFYVLPRGHDKTGFIGRITSWAIEFAKHQISAIAAATDKEQAGLLLESMKAEANLNPWLGDRLKQNNYNVRGSAGQLKIIASDAPSSSGLKADLIICDEITWWKKKDLFDVLYSGAEKRPGCIFIIITNAGMKGSWQHNALKLAKRDSDWHVYEAPENQTLASWMSKERVAKLRTQLTRGIARRVLDNLWIDATETPLLTPELILPCVDQGTLWTTYHRHFGYKAELYIGIDVGRTKDLTVVTTIELVDGIAWLREIFVMENTRFQVQKREIKSRLTRSVVKCNIDMGGIGYQLAEELAEEYPGIVEGMGLSSGRQGQLGAVTKSYFEGQMIRIPDDPILHQDLQQVSEIETGSGGLPIIRTDASGIGHADRFWSIALGLSGLPIDLGPKYHRPPRGHRSRYAQPA